MTIRLTQFPIDEHVSAAVRSAVEKNDSARRQRWAELPDPDGLRELAGRIKHHTLDHLDFYLTQLRDSVSKRGGHVHFAADGAEATRVILDIARRANVRGVIKSKSMVSEEIDLAQGGQVAPAAHERFLGSVLGAVRVAKDQACDGVAVIDDAGGKDLESIVIAAARPLDQLAVHGPSSGFGTTSMAVLIP